MAEFYRKYEFSQESSSGAGKQWESPDGTIHKIEKGSSVGLRVRKTFYQDTPNFPFNVGDTFTIKKEFGDTFLNTPYSWNILTAVCQSISVSDELLMVRGKTPVRLWQVAVEGVVVGSGSEDSGVETLRKEESETQELNGSVEVAVDGSTVILKRSKTPRIKRSVKAYGDTRTCPVAVGSIFDGGTVINTTSTRQDILANGTLVKTLYSYDIEVIV